MLAYTRFGDLPAKIIHASTENNAKVINFSFINQYTYIPTLQGQSDINRYNRMKDAIEEVLDNGSLIVAGVGNSNIGSGSSRVNFTPWANLYDGIVLVSALGPNDVYVYNGQNATNAPTVDLCAPGFDIMGANWSDPSNPNDWPYHGSYAGTSFAAPLVSGTAALMYSVNSCLSGVSAEDILKSTTDQPNTDWADYPGLLGTGRLNAEKAVQAAQMYHSSTLDLFTKAHEKDLGFSGSYSWIWGQHDNSPDIWVRQQPDGFENREHENPVYNNPGDKAYVYVRVRNKSCVSSLSNEPLSVYWNRASAGGSSWPQDWDGTNAGVGDKIGTLNIPSLGPGEHTIIEFEWELDNLGINNTSNVCLLSRIESTNDPITPYPQLHDEIFHNNNIALKNLNVVRTSLGGGLFDNQFPMPAGDVFRIGNPYDDAQNTYDVVFEVAPNLNYDLFEIGEVYVSFQEEFWDVLNQSSAQFEGIDIVENQMMQITSPQASITGLNYQEREMIDMYVGFAFFAEYAEVETEFMYTISQFDHNSLEEESFRGSTHFRVIKEAGDYFEANAGGDQEIYTGETATLQAVPINQSAQYKWYLGDSLVDTGLTLNVSPETNTSYKLEVTTDSTWYKAYDEAQVIVKHRWITNVSPNPAANNVLVEYDLKPGTANAHVTISNTSGTVSQNYTLNTSTPMSSINIDVSGLQTGAYSITLVADGVARQTRMLVKQ